MFDKATRTLMAMLFERGAVDEIEGKTADGSRWSVDCHRPNLFQDYTYFDGYVSGAYNEDFRGDTLEETLSKMDTWMEEKAGAVEMVRMVLV